MDLGVSMLATKIIKCKVVELTKIKQAILDAEYNNLQDILQLSRLGLDFLPLYDNISIYSANKATTLWQTKKIRKKNYPICIRNDLIRLEQRSTKLTKHWIRIPVKKRYGGVWLPVKPHCEIPEGAKIADSKLLRRKSTYWIYLVVKKEISEISYSSVLAIDLGERVIATACDSFDNQRPTFYGKEVRGTRRHYAWLRKRLGNKKLLRMIKKVGRKERKRVDEVLHAIARKIVERSVYNRSIIFLGDLKGIRSSAKGKRMRRIVGNMPYLKLTQYIEYKAAWQGIRVVKISERGTSRTCSRCGEKGKRPYQGLFKCPACGYQANADHNGAKNILKRSLEYISNDGAIAFSPKTELESVSAKAD